MSRPGRFIPGEEIPIVQEGELAVGPVWTGAESLAPPGVEIRTAQPVASPHTDYTIQAASLKGKTQDKVTSFNCDKAPRLNRFTQKATSMLIPYSTAQ